MKIELEIDELAAALIAEEAAKESRTGARALRDIFAEVINDYEFDPWQHGKLEAQPEGGWRLRIDPDKVRAVLKRRGR